MCAVTEVQATAAMFWRRIVVVVRSHEGEDWPPIDAELSASRRGRPIWKVGYASYTLEDESRDPAEDRVIEITDRRHRVLGPGGVVLLDRPVGPGAAPAWG